MRTTLDIADDVLAAAKERARREAAKLLHHDRSDVIALSRDQRASRILRVNHSAQERVRRNRVAG